MLQKILCVGLLVCCVIGCTIESPENDAEESVLPTPTVPTPVAPVEAERLPEFHGEFISGKLNHQGSEMQTLRINAKRITYYHTLNLLIKDFVSIIVVLDEPALAYSDKEGRQIVDEDILLVELDRLIEPGTWNGRLVKNVTQNISFERD